MIIVSALLVVAALVVGVRAYHHACDHFAAEGAENTIVDPV